jgi:hypothetical protein
VGDYAYERPLLGERVPGVGESSLATVSSGPHRLTEHLFDSTICRVGSEDTFRSALNDQARVIARRSDTRLSAGLITSFLTASGWHRSNGQSLWTHDSGTPASRIEALAASLAAHREVSNQWPAFCESCWRVGAAGGSPGSPKSGHSATPCDPATLVQPRH